MMMKVRDSTTSLSRMLLQPPPKEKKRGKCASVSSLLAMQPSTTKPKILKK